MSCPVYRCHLTSDQFDRLTRLIQESSLEAQQFIGIGRLMKDIAAELRRRPLDDDELRDAMLGMSETGHVHVNFKIGDSCYEWFKEFQAELSEIVGRFVVSREVIAVMVRAALARHEGWQHFDRQKRAA